MLCELSIRNFAIIDDLTISFSPGLTVLSGETGAGKSIIINAVNLLLGNRASSKMIRSGAETAELEAFFKIPPHGDTAAAMNDLGYDASEDLLIRRIITRGDRHKIYVNGHLATVQVLNTITENLASISGQHAHQGLLKDDQHLLILDQFAGLLPERERVRILYQEIVPKVDALHRLIKKEKRQEEQIELLRFQRDEILAAGIVSEEDVQLEKEQVRLRNARSLIKTVQESINDLYTNQNAVLERLQTMTRRLESAAKLDTRLSPQASALENTTFHIEDIYHELRDYLSNLDLDESRLEMVESRLDLLRKLKRKYGGTLEAVADTLESIEKQLTEVERISERIEEAKIELEVLNQELVQASRNLSEKRVNTGRELSKRVEVELDSLKMPNTRFEVLLEQRPAADSDTPYLSCNGYGVSETGMDRAVFTISPNPGEALKPLAAIASGGELSRVVLALKAILATNDSVETVIFDEVDAGIGGGVAEMVGIKLLALARHHQVICITHLPQIARFADHHFRISKFVEHEKTRTTIEPVEGHQRVEEIARMLGGINITKATLDHASELLKTRHGQQKTIKP